MPRDDLRERYMAADRAHTQHRANCTTCQAGTACVIEKRLDERLARLQNAYLNRLRKSH
ncbi:hypothetical protein [Streptomyces sp. V1I6]|uniref:hypothetical protein n=1 Tax=Streptomyces sp. V1I6 TaxID=3042273 RepID=UPI00277D9C18|nr:hypothetical protein [Streptomyces sp. V1I6]MDQ0847580.1 hypothetical protein [Streptomyces sp. V1I6]